MGPQWLRWVKRLQAIAQDGLTYATDDYDVGRYERLREIAAEILAPRSTREHELPDLALSRVTPTQIRRFFEHHRCPDLPAGFD